MNAPAELAWNILDDTERRRAAGFLRTADRDVFASAHIALRRLLGAYMGMPPQDVDFARELCPSCREPHGRPVVSLSARTANFSLSRRRGMVLIGIAATLVGVDVESLPDPRSVATCSPALHPREHAEIQGLPLDAHPAAFAQIWTRKEAYLKALGTGLARDPTADYFGATLAARPADWTVLDVPCGRLHRAAVAFPVEQSPSLLVHALPADWVRADWSASEVSIAPT
ncbi:4'-phosphopantetheinyl transferase superfamily protein [Streptacidiphilus sp. MAP12-16]|uniref:4'-phosphopantetheinyl transferase family protein n=1 Tax=Streptacidiphilus sp. MAP12-16 TaxID=3156300 RepID=UPI0035123C6F